MSAERYKYIDALRGIAIAGVLITHCASITSVDGALRKITNMGGMGVQLFFVISAFTIFLSLSKEVESPNRNRDFFIRRLFRIVPIYWLGIILYTAVYGLNSRGWREGPELWHYPFHVFLVNVLHPLTSSSVVPGGWSISCEVLFYIMVPFLFTFAKGRKNMIILTVICLIIFPIINMILRKYLMARMAITMDERDINEFFYRWILNQIGCFIFGILLFKIQKKKFGLAIFYRKDVNFVLTSLCIITLFLIPFYSLPLPGKHHLYAAVFMCMGLLLSKIQWKFFVNTFTVFLGKISYSCYLIHFLIIKQVSDIIKKFAPALIMNTTTYFITITLLCFLITLPIAYYSYKYFELTAVKSGKKLISYLNKTSPVLINKIS